MFWTGVSVKAQPYCEHMFSSMCFFDPLFILTKWQNIFRWLKHYVHAKNMQPLSFLFLRKFLIEQIVQTVKWGKLFWPEGGSVDSFEEVVITGIYVQHAMLTC